MLLVYTPKITNRLQYVFSVILDRLGGISYSLTADTAELLNYNGPKVNYSDHPIESIPYIASRPLLTERGIRETEIKTEYFGEVPCFFLTYKKQSLFRFDPFCAAFYMLTRYEEYLPYIKDKYDRFDATESIAYKNGFLEMPVVNIWAEMLANKLCDIFPEIKRLTKEFRFIPTYDIDAAFAYKHKGLVRNVGGLLKSLFSFDVKELVERFLVLAGNQPDPFDTYDYQLKLQEDYQLKPVYFILFADYGLNDKNTPPDHVRFQELIKRLADYAEVGIHPSYTSNSVPGKLTEEVYRLGRVLNKDIRCSRQHFLKLYFPATYRNLINLDISDDYTMGFASHPGFRAGICDPYPFYDLESEKETSLMIHPFAVMDGTLRDYLALEPDQAVQRAKTLIDQVRGVKGTFITLWHNESLSDRKRWQNWRNVYTDILDYACDKPGMS